MEKEIKLGNNILALIEIDKEYHNNKKSCLVMSYRTFVNLEKYFQANTIFSPETSPIKIDEQNKLFIMGMGVSVVNDEEYRCITISPSGKIFRLEL